MAENDTLTPDELMLAMTHAYVALAKTLKRGNHLEMDQLYSNLNEVSDRLERTEHHEASEYISTTLSPLLRRI